MVSYYRAEFVVTYPGSIRFPSSANGSVCGNGAHSRSLGNFQICPGFYFPFCIVFTMSICAASGLFRSVWLAWAFSGLYWACTQSQPGMCLSQLCKCRPSLLANLCDDSFHKQYFQVWALPTFPNWVPLTMTEKLLVLLTALAEPCIHQAWGRWNTHSISQILILIIQS